jgi:hypothetical protein
MTEFVVSKRIIEYRKKDCDMFVNWMRILQEEYEILGMEETEYWSGWQNIRKETAEY